MKKILFFLMILAVLMITTGCGETKTLHCDHCGKEVDVKANSNMEENWIIYCEECNEKLFGDNPLLGNN